MCLDARCVCERISVMLMYDETSKPSIGLRYLRSIIKNNKHTVISMLTTRDFDEHTALTGRVSY